MADNVTTQSSTLATIPASTKISTDEDATNGHVQRMKLAVSADGSSTHIGADANGLQVQGAAADGAAVAGNPVLVGGDDGTNAVNIAVDSDGAVHIADGGNTITIQEAAAMDVSAATVTVTDDGSFTLAANSGVDIGDVGIKDVAGTVSSNNSSTSTLAGGATFTGTGEDVTNYAAIKVNVFTDQASASDGLQLQFSSDNSNWDISYDFTVTANEAWVGEVGPEAQYFRVVYTNGGSAQGSFRLQTIYHPVSTEKLGVPIGSTVENEDNAQLVRSIITGQAPDTTYSNIGITNGGSLKISLEEADGLAGQATMANSVPVAIASDQSALDVSGATVTVTDDGSFTLAANSGVDIGDVDILSIVPGTGATNLGKAEDAAHTTGDTGVMALAVRNDGGSALSGTDGDYTPLGTDSSGNLYVNVAAGSASGTEYTEDAAAPANPDGGAVALVRQDTPASLTTADGDIVIQRATDYGAAFCQILDSNGNFVDSFGGSGGTSMTDDGAFTVGTTNVTPMAALVDETTPDSADEGDAGIVRMTADRKLLTRIVGATDGNRADVDGSGHLQVDIAADSVGIGGGTQYTEDDAAPANPVGTAFLAERDDALGGLTPIEGDWTHLFTDANGALWTAVNNTVTVDLGANNDVTIDNSSIVHAEDAAHNTGDAGVMSLAVRNDTLAALGGTDGDYAPFQVNASGALFIQEGAAMDVSAATVTVDNAGTFATQVDGDALTALQKIDDPVLVDDAAFTPATSSVMMAGFEFDDTTPDSVDEGDAGAARMSANRNVYTQIRDAAGNERGANVNASNQLSVSVDNSPTLGANSGVDIGDVDVTSVVPGTGATSLGKAEDAAHTTGDTGVMTLAVRNDTLAALAGTDGDYAPFQVNASGALFIQEGAAMDVSAATVNVQEATPLDVSAATVTVDLGANNDVTIDNSSIVHLEDAVHGTGDAGVMSLAVRNDTLAALAGTDGDYAPFQVNASGALYIQEGSALDVSAATVTVDLGANNDIQGDVASDGVDSGNPVKIGALAKEMDGTDPGSVAEGDRTDLKADRNGRLLINPAHPNNFKANDNQSTAQTNTQLEAAPGANLRLVITDIIMSTDTAMNIKLVEDTAGTPADVAGPFYFAANGGISTNLQTPIKITANTDVGYTSSDAGNHTVTIMGYTEAA